MEEVSTPTDVRPSWEQMLVYSPAVQKLKAVASRPSTKRYHDPERTLSAEEGAAGVTLVKFGSGEGRARHGTGCNGNKGIEATCRTSYRLRVCKPRVGLVPFVTSLHLHLGSRTLAATLPHASVCSLDYDPFTLQTSIQQTTKRPSLSRTRPKPSEHAGWFPHFCSTSQGSVNSLLRPLRHVDCSGLRRGGPAGYEQSESIL